MKRLYPLLFISVLIYWGCEEEQPEEVDTTPPTVSISSHSSGQTVNEIVTILVTTQDNEGIDRVEFYIDDSLFFTDTELPYEYQWNTTQYEDNSEHIVKVISYDNSDNSTESQPIMLIVENRVYLWGEYYPLNTTVLDLSYNQLTEEIPPEIGNLTNLEYLSLLYNQLIGSIPPEIGSLTNLTHLNLGSNNLTGSIPPEIGNLTNLTLLYLHENQLTGSIPSEIGNLPNLTYLKLSSNQLSGIIPDEICNQGDSSPGLSNNQLCPPYPTCVEDFVGEQDTTNCN